MIGLRVFAELLVCLIEGSYSRSYSRQDFGGSEKGTRQRWGAVRIGERGVFLLPDENDGEASGQPPSVVFHGSGEGFQHQEGKRPIRLNLVVRIRSRGQNRVGFFWRTEQSHLISGRKFPCFAHGGTFFGSFF